jgi:hypothetical protein
MKSKDPHQPELSLEELQLIERLREHPELMERFRTILEITASGEGPLKRADEVEDRLIEEMRRLGNATMKSWASRAERTVAEQLKQKDPSAGVRKKNADVVVCLRRGERDRTGLADPFKELYAFVA